MATIIEKGDRHSIKNRFNRLSVNNAYAVVSLARHGINPQVFYDFARAIKMREKDLAGILNLSAKTVSNYKERQKVLGPKYSEHLLKLIALFEKGENIFGNIDEFNYWLKRPFWNSKETPLDWIITSGGVDILMEELDMLAQGYPV